MNAAFMLDRQSRSWTTSRAPAFTPNSDSVGLRRTISAKSARRGVECARIAAGSGALAESPAEHRGHRPPNP